MRSPRKTSPRLSATFEPEISPVPGRCRPEGGHTNGSSEYAYCSCVLSLYTLFTKSGIGSPSEYDLIDQPGQHQHTIRILLARQESYRVCRKPERAARTRARTPSSSLGRSDSRPPSSDMCRRGRIALFLPDQTTSFLYSVDVIQRSLTAYTSPSTTRSVGRSLRVLLLLFTAKRASLVNHQ